MYLQKSPVESAEVELNEVITLGVRGRQFKSDPPTIATMEWYRQLKKDMFCKSCGETHPAVLDFHHRDPRQKVESISRMFRKKYTLEQIQREIEKCDVLCANCHRKTHWEEKNETRRNRNRRHSR